MSRRFRGDMYDCFTVRTDAQGLISNYIPEFDKESDDEWFEDMLLDAFSPD